jgi:hypothetical protein
LVNRREGLVTEHDQGEGVVVARRGDVVSAFACTRGENRPVGREEEEVLEPQRTVTVEEELRREEAEVVAGRREV